MSVPRLRRSLAGPALLLVTVGAALAVPRVRRALGPQDVRADTAVTSRAIERFAERWSDDPWNLMVGGRLADRYLARFGVMADLRDVDSAEAVARRLVGVAPEGAVAHARLALILLARHEFGEAYDVARRAVAADSTEEAAWAALFDAAIASGRYAEARQALERMAAGSLARELRRARWLDATGRPTAAYRVMRDACLALEAARARPQTVAWCLTELARIGAGVMREDSTAGLLEHALAVYPGYRGAVERMADAALARSEWSRAAGLYRRIAVDAHPDLYLRLAEAFAALHDADAARRYEERFLEVATAPGAEPLYAQPLALFYAAHPATRDSALAVALRDVARRPTVESHDVLRRVYLLRGEVGEAAAVEERITAIIEGLVTGDRYRVVQHP